jgi:drug/metabolite transporter (DMT)-like permease
VTAANQRDVQFAYALLFLTPALFATNMLTARHVGPAIPPVALAFLRWTLAFAILLPFVWRALQDHWPEIARNWRGFMVLGALGMGVCGAPVYLATHTTTAGNIGLIYSAAPVMIVALSWLGWGERIGWLQALGIVVSLSGVLTILARGEFSTLLGLSFVAGDLLAVAAMIAWGFYSVYLRHWPSAMGVLPRFAVITGFGALVNLPFWFGEMALGAFAPPTLFTLAVVLILALVPALGAYLAYAKCVATLGPGRTGLLMYLVPVYTAGLGALLLGEQLHPFHALGLVLILGGVWLGTRRPASSGE